MMTFSRHKISKMRITGDTSMPPRWQQCTYRPQHRLGNAKQELSDGRYDLIMGIDHVEGD